MQYVWKDIVKVNGWISAEAYPISGKMTIVLMMCKHI